MAVHTWLQGSRLTMVLRLSTQYQSLGTITSLFTKLVHRRSKKFESTLPLGSTVSPVLVSRIVDDRAAVRDY